VHRKLSRYIPVPHYELVGRCLDEVKTHRQQSEMKTPTQSMIQPASPPSQRRREGHDSAPEKKSKAQATSPSKLQFISESPSNILLPSDVQEVDAPLPEETTTRCAGIIGSPPRSKKHVRAVSVNEGKQSAATPSTTGSTHNHHLETHFHFHQPSEPEELERILRSQCDLNMGPHHKGPVNQTDHTHACGLDEDDNDDHDFLGQITLGLRVYTQKEGAEVQGQLRSSMNFSYCDVGPLTS
jgi:hypothetical protein